MNKQNRPSNEEIRQVYQNAHAMLAVRGGEVKLRTSRERNAIAYDLANAGVGILALESVMTDDTDTVPAVSFFGRCRYESGHWSATEELRVDEAGGAVRIAKFDEPTPAVPESLSLMEVKALGLAVAAIARHLN